MEAFIKAFQEDYELNKLWVRFDFIKDMVSINIVWRVDSSMNWRSDSVRAADYDGALLQLGLWHGRVHDEHLAQTS